MQHLCNDTRGLMAVREEIVRVNPMKMYLISISYVTIFIMKRTQVVYRTSKAAYHGLSPLKTIRYDMVYIYIYKYIS